MLSKYTKVGKKRQNRNPDESLQADGFAIASLTFCQWISNKLKILAFASEERTAVS